MAAPSIFQVDYLGRVAVITISNEKKLNAMTGHQYYELASLMNEIATHDEVYITFLTAKGRYFSAGADVSLARDALPSPSTTADQHTLQTFVAFNLHNTRAFATHPKILVVGLNGPVVGFSAAITAHADLIYATPHTFLLTPFSSLGLVAEGGASLALVKRLGISKANEALIMSKRITIEELVATGYVNKVFECGKGEDEKFRTLCLREIDERLGAHLVGDSLLEIKKLIRKPDLEKLDVANVDEVFAGHKRFLTGVPQEEFRKIASGEKRHKL